MNLKLRPITPKDKEGVKRVIVFGSVFIPLFWLWIQYILNPIGEFLAIHNSTNTESIIILTMIGFLGLSAWFMLTVVSRSIEYFIFKSINYITSRNKGHGVEK